MADLVNVTFANASDLDNVTQRRGNPTSLTIVDDAQASNGNAAQLHSSGSADASFSFDAANNAAGELSVSTSGWTSRSDIASFGILICQGSSSYEIWVNSDGGVQARKGNASPFASVPGGPVPDEYVTLDVSYHESTGLLRVWYGIPITSAPTVEWTDPDPLPVTGTHHGIVGASFQGSTARWDRLKISASQVVADPEVRIRGDDNAWHSITRPDGVAKIRGTEDQWYDVTGPSPADVRIRGASQWYGLKPTS